MSRLIFGWLTGLIASVPLWLGYLIAGLFTELHFRLFPSRRHDALANLAVIAAARHAPRACCASCGA